MQNQHGPVYHPFLTLPAAKCNPEMHRTATVTATAHQVALLRVGVGPAMLVA